MKEIILNNGIKTIIKENKNTPRTAIVMYSSLDEQEKKPGLYLLLTQLLLQGTKKRNCEELALELDENAIDISFEKKADYIRIKILCLNEDVEHALEIFEDIMKNSTFDNLNKEIVKIKGELTADLDSAKIQAQDEYYRTIFKNHPYGIGREEIIKEIESVTKEDIKKAYDNIKNSSKKIISIAGDVDSEIIIQLLNKYLSDFRIQDINYKREEITRVVKNTVSIIKKEDVNQAQIFQGWIFPNIFSEDYPKIILLNTILGASGLSSRLFLELREKQGLAYNVRSVYESFALCGNFFVYIATEPKNIKVSIDGFAKEIKKIMTEKITEEELNNAKNNAIGKRQFYQETNILEASLKGYYEYSSLGYDWEKKLIESIKSITAEELLETAVKCFSNPDVLCVLAPEKFLQDAGLL